MPFKHNASRRHRIGKMKFKVTNWAEYEAGLRRRGSLTLWMTPEALSSWQALKRTARGGQPRYSDLAIETALTLGPVSYTHLDVYKRQANTIGLQTGAASVGFAIMPSVDGALAERAGLEALGPYLVICTGLMLLTNPIAVWSMGRRARAAEAPAD